MREKKKLRNLYYGNFKVVIFGDPEVGKSTLSQRYLINLFHSDSKMTIGVNFYTKDIIVNDKPYKIHFWDLTEKEIFRSLLPWYVRGAEGGLFIYDVTNYASLSHLDEWLTIIKKEIKEEDQFPIIVVGNKGDLKMKGKSLEKKVFNSLNREKLMALLRLVPKQVRM